MCCRTSCGCGNSAASSNGCGCGRGGASGSRGCGCGCGCGNQTPVCSWEYICHWPTPLLRGEAVGDSRSFEEERGCGCG